MHVAMAMDTRDSKFFRRWNYLGQTYFDGDFKALPPTLASWKLHCVWASLSIGWRVLFSEIDVLWLPPSPGQASALHTLSSSGTRHSDLAIMSHPHNRMWNYGLFFAQGGRAASFFGCATQSWEKFALPRCTCLDARAVGRDQDHIFSLWSHPQQPCGGSASLRVANLSRTSYATCRGWVGRREPGANANLAVVHATYCRRLSNHSSVEDACKRRIVERFLGGGEGGGGAQFAQGEGGGGSGGGVSEADLTSEEWNRQQGC